MAKTLKDLVAAARAQIEEISAEQLQQIKESGTEFLLVDVREAAEYAAGHIAGAASIPRGVIELSADQVYPKRHEKLSSARNLQVIVYCASGGRGGLAAAVLQQMGFERVQSLAGGVGGWKELGLELAVP
jgi:rhodanese-related sulfurtransferase